MPAEGHWLYSFEYKGNPPEWSIMVMDQGYHNYPYSMITAAQAGWTLPEIIQTINTSSLKEIERLRMRITELEFQLAGKPPPDVI